MMRASKINDDRKLSKGSLLVHSSMARLIQRPKHALLDQVLSLARKGRACRYCACSNSKAPFCLQAVTLAYVDVCRGQVL